MLLSTMDRDNMQGVILLVISQQDNMTQSSVPANKKKLINDKSLCLCSGVVGCVLDGLCFSKAHLPSTSHPQNREEQLSHFLSATRAGRGSAFKTTASRRERGAQPMVSNTSWQGNPAKWPPTPQCFQNHRRPKI